MHDLGTATTELARVAGHVTEQDLDRPTPCADWTVRDLLVHLLGLTAHFTTVARHAAPVEVESELPVDWSTRLTGRLDDLAAAWREPDAWTGEGEAGGVRMSNAEFGVVALDEVVLHGWDLAVALGVPFAVTDDDVAAIHGFVASFEHASAQERGGLFGAVVDHQGVAGFDRVLALSGRSPRWACTARPGRPPVVDQATWQAARDALLVREKAHTREGDAIAAARRRLPVVELDGSVEVVGPDGPVPFLELFAGRRELAVYQHMWHDGAPHQGQCEGCTLSAWHLDVAAPYLAARGVSFAILTTGPWSEVAPFVAFMGYTQPWYSVRDVAAPIGGEMGYLACFLRDGDRVFLTYSTTARGTEAVDSALQLLDMTPYGRDEAWEDRPDGRPTGHDVCWYWRTDADGNATWGGTSRPVAQWTRPGATPETTLGRGGRCH